MKKILIYGKGRVGNAIAKLCDFKEIDYDILDDYDLKEIKEIKEINFKKYDYIIPSPGITPEHFIYKKYSNKIIGELDFAYKFLNNLNNFNNLNIKTIGITGTDGKSTTSHVLFKLLEKRFGKESIFLGGNFDSPLSEIVLKLEKDIKTKLKSSSENNIFIILEISSFMAHNIKDIYFDYSIFTNFNPDHLNWHKNLKEYFNDKFKVIKHTKYKSVINNKINYVYNIFNEIEKSGIKKDNIILFLEYGNKSLNNLNNLNNLEHLDNLNNKKINFIKTGTTGAKGIEIITNFNPLKNTYFKYNFNDYILKGTHNAENILSVILIAEEIGLDSSFINNTLKNISGLEHRIELISEKNGIKYVEDSKCTTSQSLLASLSSFEGNIILIVGGDNKGEDFLNVVNDIKTKVKYLVILGTDMKDIFTNIAKKSGVKYGYAINMNEAVDLSNSQAKTGDVILLSPGCSSFDIFKNWLDRAEQFRGLVLQK